MKILGLIPARAGSRGIPRKNLAPLGGRPLIAWTIAAARATRVDRVVVSTDDADIAAVSRQHGAETPFLRPARLAGDDTPALPVIADALDALERDEGWCADAVAYLQPTSPFRDASDIDAAIALLGDDDTDTVVSVMPVPHNMLPSSLMRETPAGRLEFLAAPGQRRFRRQDKNEKLLARNGPAVLLVRAGVIRSGRIYGDRVRGMEMNRLRSLDIDEPFDLRLAEALVPLVRSTSPSRSAKSSRTPSL